MHVSGEVEVGVVDRLPLEGVDVLLGNDLTDSCCHEKCSSPLIVSSEVVIPTHTPPEEIDIYPACITNRSMTKAKVVDEDINLIDTCLPTEIAKVDKASEALIEHVKLQNSAKSKPVAKPALIESSRVVSLKVDWSLQSLRKAQQTDETLKQVRAEILDEIEDVKKDILFKRRTQKEASENGREQVVVPQVYRTEIMSLAHESLFAGHLGRTKTYERIATDFYSSGMSKDVDKSVKTCDVCQMARKPNQIIPSDPLKIVPVVGETFSNVLIYTVGPLPKTAQGNQYILTVMCITTRFPEAIPLRKITANRRC